MGGTDSNVGIGRVEPFVAARGPKKVSLRKVWNFGFFVKGMVDLVVAPRC